MLHFQDPDVYPNLLCVITGKGPLKEFYKDCIDEYSWNHVKFLMPWLEPGNIFTAFGYPFYKVNTIKIKLCR